jgi:hypothetical protein
MNRVVKFTARLNFAQQDGRQLFLFFFTGRDGT